MHAVMPIWAAAEIAAASFAGRDRAASAVMGVGAFALAAVWRELVKGLARVHTEEDEPVVVAWPLGGLTISGRGWRGSQQIPSEWWGLVAGMGWTGFWAFAVWLGGWGPLVFNPLDPIGAVHPGGIAPGLVVWWFYAAGVCITLCNALLPMAPFDLGRLLRREHAGGGAVGGDVRVGYVAAMTLFVGAAALGHTRLMAVAAIGALVTWLDSRRGSAGMLAGEHPVSSYEPLGPPESRIIEETAVPTMDEVLEKISREGLGSLTGVERAVLEEERRRRMGEGK